MKRKSYKVYKAKSLKNILLEGDSLSSPLPNEVSIAVKAIGLNYADLFAIMGLYSATPKGTFVPGLEFSGEVIHVGSLIKSLKPGDKVMGVTKFGAYATHLNIDERYIVPLPDNWTWEEGAAFPVQVLTAYYALFTLGNLKPGQTVLIHSAAGGVGLLANRIAKKFDAYTIGVVGRKEKLEKLKEEGYDEGIVRSSKFKGDLRKALKGRDLHLVLEATGDKYFTWSYEMLASQGRLVAYGSAQFTPTGPSPNFISLAWKYVFRPRINPLSMITANKSVMAFNLIWLYEKAGLFHELMEEIMKLQLSPPFVGHVFPFEELPKALDLFKSGKTMGKVIVKN